MMRRGGFLPCAMWHTQKYPNAGATWPRFTPRRNGCGRGWEFNALLKTSHCTGPYNGLVWRKEDYARAQSAIAADGDGLGRGFIEQFMPSPPHSNALLKNSMCTDLYTSKKWSCQVYSQAKAAIAAKFTLYGHVQRDFLASQ